jgi:hypothetical protein
LCEKVYGFVLYHLYINLSASMWLFAKFNNVCIVSTQDNPVWELYEHSIHFKDVEFLTIQDIAFLMVSNGGKEIRKVGRAAYKHVTNIRSNIKKVLEIIDFFGLSLFLKILKISNLIASN